MLGWLRAGALAFFGAGKSGRGQKGLFKRTTVSAEVAGASLSVALAPVSETQTGSERPNLARTGLVALM